MIGLGGIDALTRAQATVDGAARRIARGPASPDDMVQLLEGRRQFETGVKLMQTEDQMNGKLLDILA